MPSEIHMMKKGARLYLPCPESLFARQVQHVKIYLPYCLNTSYSHFRDLSPTSGGLTVGKGANVNSKFVAARIAVASSMSLLALPALADDGQYVTSLYENPSPGRTYFSAQQGADYILYATYYGTVSIVNPTGGPSPVLNPNGNALEAQFRAAYTASYGLDVEPSYYAYGAVYIDCRDDTKTSSLLTTSRSQHGTMLTRGDRDWYRVSLRKGQRVQFALTSSYQ